MLQIKGLEKKYGNKKVLNNVSFNIDTHSVVGLIGDNGAGKTTLIKCICNLVSASDGEILFNGTDLLKDSGFVQKHVGVLLEGARNLYNFLSVDYNLNYFGYLNRLSDHEIEERKNRLLKEFELEKYKNQTVNELSRGTQQKVALMVTLMKNPELLILDEPTLGMDLLATVRMTELLIKLTKEEQKTIIIISHDMTLITKLCSKIIYLQDGTVKFEKTISEILESKEFAIKLNRLDNVLSVLESNSITYEENTDDGSCVVKTDELSKILSIVPSSTVISIEKQQIDLDTYIKAVLNYK